MCTRPRRGIKPACRAARGSSSASPWQFSSGQARGFLAATLSPVRCRNSGACLHCHQQAQLACTFFRRPSDRPLALSGSAPAHTRRGCLLLGCSGRFGWPNFRCESRAERRRACRRRGRRPESPQENPPRRSMPQGQEEASPPLWLLPCPSPAC